MSVINQMLQGLDKGAQQQQADIDRSGAVIVAAPKGPNKLFIFLFASIIVFAVLAGYLFLKKQESAATISPPNSESAAPQEHQVEENIGLVAKELQPELVEQADLAETQSMQPHILAVPVGKSAVTPSTVTQPAVVQAGADKVVAKVAKPNPVTVAVAPVPVPALVERGQESTKQVHVQKDNAQQVQAKKVPVQQVQGKKAPVKQIAATPESESTDEDVISIKAVTRTVAQQAQLYAKQAEAALLAGDKERAKTLFAKVLTFDKQHDLSREKLAAILYGEQRTQSAVKLLQEGLSVSPEYTSFRLMLARIYLKNKNKPQAYYYLKPHQPKIEGNVDYYALLAGLAQSLDDLDTALVAYQKLTEHEPNRARWWLGLGITADKAKQVTLALNAYHVAQNMGQLSASSRNYINARITQLEKQ